MEVVTAKRRGTGPRQQLMSSELRGHLAQGVSGKHAQRASRARQRVEHSRKLSPLPGGGMWPEHGSWNQKRTANRTIDKQCGHWQRCHWKWEVGRVKNPNVCLLTGQLGQCLPGAREAQKMSLVRDSPSSTEQGKDRV